MINWTERVIDALATLPGPWMVLPGEFTPTQPICGEYASARSAADALRAAGFKPTSRFVSIKPLDAAYDPKTLLRYSAGQGCDVLLVRRLGPVVTAPSGDADRPHDC